MVLRECLTSNFIFVIFRDLADRSWKSSHEKPARNFLHAERLRLQSTCGADRHFLQTGETNRPHQDDEFEFNAVGNGESLKAFEQRNGIIHNMRIKIKQGR